jgi:serine/threonine protein kinase
VVDLPQLGKDAESGSLGARLERAIPVILRNGWATSAQTDHMRVLAQQSPEPLPSAGRSVLCTFLVEAKLLTKEQANELDQVLKCQALLQGFTLHRKIGSGGMGTVFLATHAESGREVALKTINTRLADEGDFVSRFHRESAALTRVRHAHVAEILGSGEADGHCWLAMEFIDGPSLMGMLKDHKVLPEAYALTLVKQVAEGLAHVWESAQMVHRDIKPENILVLRQRDGDQMFPLTDVAKIIDFGLVKTCQEDERLTQTGMTIGTPLYMSPEQVRGDRLDCRSDIYGLGATLYHLITGTTPFIGTSPGAIMSAHLTQVVPNPGDRVPSLNPLTRDLVMTAMAKEVDKRFLTFPGMIAAINKALAAIDHHTTDFPKLLRKPMVIKGPVQTATQRRSAPATPPRGLAEAQLPAIAPTPITKPVSDVVRPPPAAKASPATGTANATGPRTEQIRKPISEQVFKPLPQPATDTSRSAAFVEDAHETHGLGLLPWIVLAGTILIGLVYWFFLQPA